MKKFAILLPVLALSCAASMAAVTTTTSTTTHTTRVEPTYDGPTVVTIHTRPATRHVHRRHVTRTVRHVASASGGSVTTTVHKHSTQYD